MVPKNLPDAWLAHDERVRPYIRLHRWISTARTLLGLFLLWYVLVSRQLVVFEGALTERGATGFTLFLWFFGSLAVFWEVVSFPFSVSSYAIDRSFKVSRQSFPAWLADHAKGLVVGGALGLIVLLFVWYAVTSLGSLAWVAIVAFFILFSVVLAQLAPVLLLPLFFKMNPLPEGELRRKLLETSASHGVPVKEIYLLGLGAKTEKGNAAFMGLGKTKRIAIGDTIYEKYPAEQVLAVFAHELGHMVHKDIWKGLSLSAFSLFVTFGIANFLCQHWILPAWFTWMETPFGLLLFFVTLSFVGMPFGFLERGYSRWRERLADGFAVKMRMGRPLADALEALTYQNRSYFVPSPLREFLLFSHPAPWRRITSLKTDVLA